MELISKLLFWVANSLLIPDIIILLCLFVRSLILIGGTYNMYMTKRKNDKALDQLIKDARIDDCLLYTSITERCSYHHSCNHSRRY